MLIFLYIENDYIMNKKTPVKSMDLPYLLKCYYFSTNLPISLYSNGKLDYSYPERIEKADSILKRKAQNNSILQNDNNIQIIQNEYKEIYILIEYKKYNIDIGPFLSEQIDIGMLTNMVRNNLIPFHQKTKMMKYYKSLQIVTEEKAYYLTQLLQSILGTNTRTQNNTVPSQNSPIINNDTYYKQKDEYRKISFLHVPYFKEQEISNYIKTGNIDKAIKQLAEINIQPHAKLASTSLRSYKNSMICSCSYMTRAAMDGGVNQNDAFTLSDSFINEIENIQSIEELNQLEINMVESFANKVKDIKTQKYSPAILNCINYIDNHLCDDLSIKELSNTTYLNGSYLSTLFHKETGHTINEWITTHRIKEAARMLLNGDNSISEITYLYRFCSQSYFIQCFKKIMGVTPNEYKYAKGNIS